MLYSCTHMTTAGVKGLNAIWIGNRLGQFYSMYSCETIGNLEPAVDTAGVKLVLARQSTDKFPRFKVTQTDHTRSLVQDGGGACGGSVDA